MTKQFFNPYIGYYENNTEWQQLVKKHDTDAGQDIVTPHCVWIHPGMSTLVDVNVKLIIPEGCVGLIWAKSGLSTKYNLEIGAGCIDQSYRGNIKIHLYNHSDKRIILPAGTKIAQLLTVPIYTDQYHETPKIPVNTTRGRDGFGSTGKTVDKKESSSGTTFTELNAFLKAAGMIF